MANFTMEIFSGVDFPAWTDPATISKASRLNDLPGKARKYPRAFVIPGGSPVLVEFRASLAGPVVMPGDGSLGGHLFLASWAEWSGPYPPPIFSSPGFTSYQACYVTADHEGYFQLLMSREAGGSVLVPFMVIQDIS